MPSKRYLDLKDPLHGTDKKASKPLMEKRRRARINHSLAQLKSLIIDPNTNERTRQSKLEKADILELTVRHLHEMKKRQRTVSLLENRNPRKKFEVGYSECAREVDLFLSNLIESQSSSKNAEVYKRLKQHLSRRLLDLKNIDPFGEEHDDAMITSSSSPPNLQSPKETNGFAETSSTAEESACSPTENQSYKQFLEECDTTASNFANLLNDEKVVPNYVPEQALPQVTSSCVTYDDSDSCPSTSSSPKQLPTNFFAPTRAPDNNYDQNSFSNSLTSPAFQKYPPKSSRNLCKDSLSSASQQGFKQIPLVPKHLPNGKWALMLPQDVSLAENEVHYFSAFKLVLPSNLTDSESERGVQNFAPSPSASYVSDASSDEYFPRINNEFADNSEYRNNDLHTFSNQCVWRPW